MEASKRPIRFVCLRPDAVQPGWQCLGLHHGTGRPALTRPGGVRRPLSSGHRCPTRKKK